MIDAPTLRKLGTAPDYAPLATFANACRDAADTIEELARGIDGSVRVAADSLKDVERLTAALESLAKDPPATLDEPDTDAEVIKKMRAIARAALDALP